MILLSLCKNMLKKNPSDKVKGIVTKMLTKAHIKNEDNLIYDELIIYETPDLKNCKTISLNGDILKYEKSWLKEIIKISRRVDFVFDYFSYYPIPYINKPSFDKNPHVDDALGYYDTITMTTVKKFNNDIWVLMRKLIEDNITKIPANIRKRISKKNYKEDKAILAWFDDLYQIVKAGIPGDNIILERILIVHDIITNLEI